VLAKNRYLPSGLTQKPLGAIGITMLLNECFDLFSILINGP
jgi:hypothetical protein